MRRFDEVVLNEDCRKISSTDFWCTYMMEKVIL